MTRRLLHLLNYIPQGTRAIDHFAIEYARQAAARGWHVTLGFTASPPPAYRQQLQDAGAEVVEFTVPFTLASFADLKTKMPPVDVVQTSFLSVFQPAVQALKTSGFAKRLVVIDHSSGTGPSPWSLLTPLRWWRGRRVGRIVDGIACVSQYNAHRDVNRVFLPRSKVMVIPNGIDLSRFPFIARPTNTMVTVVYAGQLTEAKGVRTLLRAVAALPKLEIQLLIAGDGPLKSEVADCPDSRVQPLGHVADMAVLFGRADIVVVPSEWAEAFGLVVIEAMACGAAVLASDAGALPEVVGDAGCIFPAGDAAKLAAGLQTLAGDSFLRTRLRLAGRKRVEDHYPLADCVRRHLDFALNAD